VRDVLKRLNGLTVERFNGETEKDKGKSPSEIERDYLGVNCNFPFFLLLWAGMAGMFYSRLYIVFSI